MFIGEIPNYSHNEIRYYQTLDISVSVQLYFCFMVAKIISCSIHLKQYYFTNPL